MTALDDRDQEIIRIMRGNPEIAFAVSQDNGELYVRGSDDSILMYTGDFREYSGEQLAAWIKTAKERDGW